MYFRITTLVYLVLALVTSYQLLKLTF